MLGALFSLLSTIGTIVLVVVLIRRARTGHAGGTAASDGHAIRRFFQYVLLFGLVVVVGIGLSGLVGRLIHTDVLVAGDDARLARDLAFSVVGLPLLLLVAYWSRRRFADPNEARSLGWAFYISAVSLTALVTAMTGLSQTLQWAVGLIDFSGGALAQFLVWGSIWGVHWWLDRRLTPASNARLHHLAGSLIGLGTAATGLVTLVGGALRTLLGLDASQLLVEGRDPLLQGLVVLAVGAPVWFVYWVRTASRHERDPLWFAYVLLAGVGAGLVAAVTAASLLLFSALVWFFGDQHATTAALHFRSSPTQAATIIVGLLVWWYHQAVLKQAAAARTEVHRVYEYLMAAIGLLAAAAGLTTAVVALIEAVSGTERVLVATSTINTLLAAVTLLLVGSPVWWLYWRRIEAVAGADSAELLSTSRRVYLFVLFGVGGVAAVISLLVGVYLLFEDLVAGRVDGETLRRMRFAIGVLLATAAISGYHFAVYRADRERAPATVPGRGPRHVLLVGPADPELAREVARRTDARVQAWVRTDTAAGTGATAWSADAVVAALEQVTADDVLVVSGAAGLEIIPVRR